MSSDSGTELAKKICIAFRVILCAEIPREDHPATVRSRDSRVLAGSACLALANLSCSVSASNESEVSVSEASARTVGETVPADVLISPTESRDELPAYTEQLTAFHRAFESELRDIIAGQEIAPGATVVDLPCGDGFYSRCLAERLGANGTLLAMDHSSAYLQLARQTTAGITVPLSFCQADIYALPLASDSVDFVWCAQSLISLAQPVLALREIRRVLRLGGTLAILENDNFHQVLLPWPVELELQLLRALHQASLQRFGEADRLCPGRYLGTFLLAAGFANLRKRTYAVDRQWPLTALDQTYLDYYFQSQWELLHEYLTTDIRESFQSYIDPGAPGYLPARPAFQMTCLNVVCTATK
jgi:ubiquinone/menaquinone biosynthesis C-methylase UbiE